MSKAFQNFLLCSVLAVPFLGASTAHAAGAMFVSETGACLDVRGGSTANRTPVQAFRCNATFAQQWNFDGTTIRGIGTTNHFAMCVAVSGGGIADGTPVLMTFCNSSTAQLWVYDHGHLVNFASHKCLDIQALGRDGTPATIQPCNAFARGQFWTTQ
jgi:hypothetical protein